MRQINVLIFQLPYLRLYIYANIFENRRNNKLEYKQHFILTNIDMYYIYT